MKYLLVVVIFLNMVSQLHSMEEKSNKEEKPHKNKHAIKLLSLPQGSNSEIIISPRSGQSPRVESPKKISPTTESRLKELSEREALPRRYSNPKGMALEEKK